MPTTPAEKHDPFAHIRKDAERQIVMSDDTPVDNTDHATRELLKGLIATIKSAKGPNDLVGFESDRGTMAAIASPLHFFLSMVDGLLAYDRDAVLSMSSETNKGKDGPSSIPFDKDRMAKLGVLLVATISEYYDDFMTHANVMIAPKYPEDVDPKEFARAAEAVLALFGLVASIKGKKGEGR